MTKQIGKVRWVSLEGDLLYADPKSQEVKKMKQPSYHMRKTIARIRGEAKQRESTICGCEKEYSLLGVGNLLEYFSTGEMICDVCGKSIW